MNALEKLYEKNKENKFVCVGLDTDINKLPSFLKSSDNPVLTFNKNIIEATKEYAAAYKINFAFYEKDGVDGIKNLSETLSFIPEDILTIADAKRGDIGNTSKMYAESVFEHFNFDSVTLNPLMGYDSLKPFLDYLDKLHFILALTSNPGSADFEKLQLKDGSFLFQKIIDKVKEWNERNNCGIVFGATNSNELAENIDRIDSLPVLLPGVGAQGGSLSDVVTLFKRKGRTGYLINVSRGIIYKCSDENFAGCAKDELMRLNKEIRNLLFT